MVGSLFPSKPRACTFRMPSGELCGATPLRSEPFCFWHSPDHQQEAAEARRLGGLRRKREGTLAGVYDFEGLASVGHIRRLVEIAVADTLGLDNSIARARTLGYLAQVAMSLLEQGELEERLATLERAVLHRPPLQGSPFDIEVDELPALPEPQSETKPEGDE